MAHAGGTYFLRKRADVKGNPDSVNRVGHMYLEVMLQLFSFSFSLFIYYFLLYHCFCVDHLLLSPLSTIRCDG